MTRLIAACLAVAPCAAPRADPVPEGRVVDADGGRPLPCRLRLQGPDPAYDAARPASPGPAVEYSEPVASNRASLERPIARSAHPFRAAPPPGTSAPTVETRKVEVGPQGAEAGFLLRRVEARLVRSREVLAPEAPVEYKEAADFYRGELEESR